MDKLIVFKNNGKNYIKLYGRVYELVMPQEEPVKKAKKTKKDEIK